MTTTSISASLPARPSGDDTTAVDVTVLDSWPSPSEFGVPSPGSVVLGRARSVPDQAQQVGAEHPLLLGGRDAQGLDARDALPSVALAVHAGLGHIRADTGGPRYDRCAGGFMTEKVSTVGLRQRIGDMIDRVALTQDEFVIERKGKPLAALVSIQRLEQMRRYAKRQALEFLGRPRRRTLSDREAMELAIEAQRWARKHAPRQRRKTT